jgi:hypothetical protein
MGDHLMKKTKMTVSTLAFKFSKKEVTALLLEEIKKQNGGKAPKGAKVIFGEASITVSTEELIK